MPIQDTDIPIQDTDHNSESIGAHAAENLGVGSDDAGREVDQRVRRAQQREALEVQSQPAHV